MHPRIDRLPPPEPDYQRLLRAVRREPVDRVPLIELAIHPKVVAALLDEPLPAADDVRPRISQQIRLQHRLGYDVVKISALIPWEVARLTADGESNERTWTDEHSGPIQCIDDIEAFPWPKPADVDFTPVDHAIAALPDGMRLLGFTGGVLEFAMDLLGMEQMMIATRRDPELVADVVERVGQTLCEVFERYCRYDAVCALWLGDDMGHKHGPLLSPVWLREHILLWHRRLAEIAHHHGRPFLLHSCGQVSDIMPSLIDDVTIDAKHSFEDGILRIEDFYDIWHDRIGVLGGVDVHLLATADEPTIRRRVREILTHCAPHGGYACGSGNSITDYIPPESFLTMVETVADFNAKS